MSTLRLQDVRDGTVHAFEDGPVLIGRSRTCQLAVSGPGSKLVSNRHARALLEDGAWAIEDVGGRNGTFLDGERLGEGERAALVPGQTLTLGKKGLDFLVDIAAAPSALTVSFVVTGTDERLHASGERIRIGRDTECELPLPGESVVSRVHCEIFIGPDGIPFIRDANSRNGTFLDNSELRGERPLREGVRIQLGPEGPDLVVDRIGHGTGTRPVQTSPPARRDEPPRPSPSGAPPPRGRAEPPRSQPAAPPVAPPAAPPATPPAAPPTAPPQPRASEPVARAPQPPVHEETPAHEHQPAAAAASPAPSGSTGRTAFFRALVHESEQKLASRTRLVVWSFVALLVVSVGGVLAVSELRVRETETELASQRAALEAARAAVDSARAADAAEYQRLELELERANDAAAPTAVMDSLRQMLEDAGARTAFLEQALERARREMTRQLSVGDSLRRAQQAETERLRSQLASGQAGGVSTEELASLREAVAAAEERAAQLESGLRAVRGADLASIAEANQEATGLVSVFVGGNIYDGSGFVISRSGYFITNRHVANPEGNTPDSVHITMADQRTGHRARVVAVQPPDGPDLAVLYIPNYVGPFIASVDWDGSRARQGEPAALIGFPAGVAAALDNTRTVRTSMSAGIFSKVTPDQIQFDGFTVGGSSGSPVFNADGEVVAVHSSGLREAAGLGFAVPVRLVLTILPEEVRREVQN